LQLAHALLAEARWKRRPSVEGRPVHLAVYPTAYLYHAHVERGLASPALADGRPVRVMLAPGFLAAPREVLEGVLRMSLGFRRKPVRARMHEFVAGPDFAEMTMALELSTEPPPGGLRGRHYDLDDVFERVNLDYFGGRLARPRLAWSRSLTLRLLGYYQQSTDRLMISQALDDPRVPRCAMEMVMYHELLHKHLGIQVVNGRHYAHTDEFRHAERRFRQYDEAQRFLAGEWQ
jgi:hypothetical protein